MSPFPSNFGTDLSHGDYFAAGMDAVGMMANASQVLRACFAFETPIMVSSDGALSGKRARRFAKTTLFSPAPRAIPMARSFPAESWRSSPASPPSCTSTRWAK